MAREHYADYFDGRYMEQKDTDRVLPRVPMRNPHRASGLETRSIEELTREELAYRHIRSRRVTQQPEVRREKTYVYWHPFQYDNIGVELGPRGEYNPDGVELDAPPLGAITIEQDEPIIGVTIIGSACVPPGYVILHAEPSIWQYPRTGVKMKKSDLWGQHVRGGLWGMGLDESWEQAGMSSVRFDIPESKKVTIMGGSEHDIGAWQQTSVGEGAMRRDLQHDAHYAFRLIRISVWDGEGA